MKADKSNTIEKNKQVLSFLNYFVLNRHLFYFYEWLMQQRQKQQQQPLQWFISSHPTTSQHTCRALCSCVCVCVLVCVSMVWEREIEIDTTDSKEKKDIRDICFAKGKPIIALIILFKLIYLVFFPFSNFTSILSPSFIFF